MVIIELNGLNRLILTENNRIIEERRDYRCDPFRINICYLADMMNVRLNIFL